MTRSLIILCLLFLSRELQAGDIEIAQWVPWSFVSKEFLNKHIEVRESERDLEVKIGELKPRLSFHAFISGDISALKFGSGQISSVHDLSIYLTVEKITIDQYIERIVAGNVFRVRIQAECAPFSLSLSRFQVGTELGFLQNGPRWEPVMTNLAVTIPDGSWAIGKIDCSAIGNLGEEIKAQLQSALQTPERFLPAMRNWLGSAILERFYAMWTELNEATGAELRVTGMGRPTAEGFFLFANYEIAASKNVGLPPIEAENLSDSNPQLIFSDKGFEALLNDKMQKLLPAQTNLQSIDGFAALMRSRFKQYLVWPDLRRFPVNNPFVYSVLPDQSELILRPSGKDYQANFRSNGVIRTIIGSAVIDYLQVGIVVQTPLSVSVRDGEIILSTGSGSVSLAAQFGLLYQMLFQPNPRMAVDLIREGLSGFFKNKSMKQTLPSIRVQGGERKLQNWQRRGTIVTMDWL